MLWHAAEEKGEEVRLELPGYGALGPLVRCRAKEGMIRFRIGDSDRTVAGRIPAGTGEAILIFFPAGEDDGADPPRQRIFAIDSSEENFPDGGAFVGNFHHRDIRLMLGEHRMQLRGGGGMGVRRPAERNAFNMAPVRVDFQQGEGWRMASESQIRFVPGMRYLILAYVDPGSGRPRVSTLTIVEPVTVPDED